ncbi:hypothetical protein [Rubidibacter lacunae]|uniref:hypothetical protein n=1 Tax=Rubidibacter lacunae TaxID=582514 RepID=UPI0003FD9713|nr:hypothetical protein [Rubidibacter lacunae]
MGRTNAEVFGSFSARRSRSRWLHYQQSYYLYYLSKMHLSHSAAVSFLGEQPFAMPGDARSKAPLTPGKLLPRSFPNRVQHLRQVLASCAASSSHSPAIIPLR